MECPNHQIRFEQNWWWNPLINLKIIKIKQFQLMGADLLVTNTGYSSRQVRLVSRIFVHNLFKHATLENDLAIMRVSVPFYRTQLFAPITRSAATPAPYKVCTVAGWGATEEVREKLFFIIFYFLKLLHRMGTLRIICNGSMLMYWKWDFVMRTIRMRDYWNREWFVLGQCLEHETLVR